MNTAPLRTTLIILLTLASTLLASQAWAQACTPPGQRVRMFISDNGGEADSVFFGHSPTASRGLDPALCEVEFPPFPPSGTFEGRFVNPPGYEGAEPPAGMGQGFKQDYRLYFSRTQRDTHRVKFQAGPGGLPITLRWSPDQVRSMCDSVRIQDEFGGVLVRRRMDIDSVLVINNAAIGSLVLIKFGAIQPVTFPGFSVAPASLAFGVTDVGGSRTDSVTVTNTGTGPLTITLAASTTPAFTVTPGGAGAIPPAGTRKYYITFSPTTVGPDGGAVVFTHDAASSPDTVTVSGTAVIPGPVFQLAPASVSFGSVVVSTTRTDSVIVSNGGTLPLIISSAVSTNPLFTVSPPSGPIPPAGSQKFYVTFTPDTLGARSGVVVFAHNADGSPDTLLLSGNGAGDGPLFTIAPRSLTFGNVGVGLSKSDSVLVQNLGTQPLNVTLVSSSQAEFSVVPRGANNIPPLGTRRFTVTFSPVSAGPKEGAVIFTHNADGSPDSVAVSGNGQVPAPQFSVFPESLDFGNVARGDSLTDSVKVTNIGTLPLIVTSAAVDQPDFRVEPAASDSIAPDGSRRFLLTFAPTSYGQQTARLFLSHNADGSPDTVILSGLAPEPLFAVSPPAAALGNVNLGDTATAIFRVTNPGAAPLVISLASSSNPEFIVAPASATIAPADSQGFSVSFIPGDLGPETAGIIFTHNADSSPDSVAVSGTGVQPGFALSATGIAFDSIGVTRSLRDTVSVSNPGSAPVFIEVFADDPSFSVSPTGPLFIQPGQETDFTVTFRPLAPGPHDGFIVFLHNAPGSPDSLALSGTGIPLYFLSLPPDTIAAKEPVRGKFLKAVRRGRGLYPNWANLIEETVAQGGFQPGASESDSAGGLRIGISFMERKSPDPLRPRWSARKAEAALYCWVRLSSWDFKKNLGKSASRIVKTLENKLFKHVTAVSPARGLDSTGAPGDIKRKKLYKQLTKLDPKKTANRLYAELLALKFSIAASQLGKTPQGFGDLVYNVDGSPLDELSLLQISRRADSLMTFWRAIPANQVLYDTLLSVIARINRAFAGPLDTVTFERGGKLMVEGKADLSAVPWLRAGDLPITLLTPTSTETETEEELEEEEPGAGTGEVPDVTTLYQNYPNPFNPSTTIAFRLVEDGPVTVTLYNLLGQEMAVILDGEELEEGYHTIEFDASRFASGVYFLRLTAGSVAATSKMLLMK